MTTERENKLKELIKDIELSLSRANNKNQKDRYRQLIKQYKAELKGNYITVDDLKEFKGLIIWNIKNCSYGFNIVKDVMNELLNIVNDNKMIFVTKRGIKGVITNATKEVTLRLAEQELRVKLGIDESVNYSEHSSLQQFLIYKLSK